MSPSIYRFSQISQRAKLNHKIGMNNILEKIQVLGIMKRLLVLISIAHLSDPNPFNMNNLFLHGHLLSFTQEESDPQ